MLTWVFSIFSLLRMFKDDFCADNHQRVKDKFFKLCDNLRYRSWPSCGPVMYETHIKLSDFAHDTALGCIIYSKLYLFKTTFCVLQPLPPQNEEQNLQTLSMTQLSTIMLATVMLKTLLHNSSLYCRLHHLLQIILVQENLLSHQTLWLCPWHSYRLYQDDLLSHQTLTAHDTALDYHVSHSDIQDSPVQFLPLLRKDNCSVVFELHLCHYQAPGRILLLNCHIQWPANSSFLRDLQFSDYFKPWEVPASHAPKSWS